MSACANEYRSGRSVGASMRRHGSVAQVDDCVLVDMGDLREQ